MERAFVFPGQGAQVVGMGKLLADAYEASRLVFEEVDDALGQCLSAIIWEGDVETLTLTENAQPALMATSIAAMKALEAEGIEIDVASYVAGHSLGEYSALCAAGSISLADTSRLLRIRGRAMQDAVEAGAGAMAAVLGLDFDSVSRIARDSANGRVCQAANDNDPRQVVVSGHREAVERAVALARERGAKRAVMLPVSAPFHCELMAPAREVMRKALRRVEIEEPKVPIIPNVSAKPERKPLALRDGLVQQVTGTVRWRETVTWLVENGVTDVYEMGVGSALSGMVRRIDRSVSCHPAGNPKQIEAVAAAILGGL